MTAFDEAIARHVLRGDTVRARLVAQELAAERDAHLTMDEVVAAVVAGRSISREAER